MKIGIGLPNQVRDVDPRIIAPWAAAAEEAGFSSLGTVGRFAYPGVQETVALAAAAAVTSRVELITGILIAPTWPGALLAKEVAGIDGISGGRLTLGVGLGARADDYPAEAHGPRGLGARLDRDLETFRAVWDGESVGDNPAVPAGTRRIPLLFGGGSAPAFARMARLGTGYVGPSAPPAIVAGTFDAARAAWAAEGRSGEPRLIALAYVALGDPDAGRANVADYYSVSGPELVDLVLSGVRTDAAGIRTVIKEYQDLGADELILNPGLADLDEIRRIADIALG